MHKKVQKKRPKVQIKSANKTRENSLFSYVCQRLVLLFNKVRIPLQHERIFDMKLGHADSLVSEEVMQLAHYFKVILPLLLHRGCRSLLARHGLTGVLLLQEVHKIWLFHL